MFRRIIKLPKSQSFFLFGARGTGKSTWLNEQFARETTVFYNLLLPKEEDRFIRDPNLFFAEVNSLNKEIETVVVDEIQKVPKLLDLVHELIETPAMSRGTIPCLK